MTKKEKIVSVILVFWLILNLFFIKIDGLEWWVYFAVGMFPNVAFWVGLFFSKKSKK